jgi:hypothetical protein
MANANVEQEPMGLYANTTALSNRKHERTSMVYYGLQSAPIPSVHRRPWTIEATTLRSAYISFEAERLVATIDVWKRRAKDNSANPVSTVGDQESHAPADTLTRASIVDGIEGFVELAPDSPAFRPSRDRHKG